MDLFEIAKETLHKFSELMKDPTLNPSPGWPLYLVKQGVLTFFPVLAAR
jgi:hypothetical protein